MTTNSRIKSALSSDFHSKDKYVSRITQRETFVVHDEDGNPIQVERDVLISWSSIEQLLAMVRKRAGIE